MQLVKGAYTIHHPDGRVIPLTFNTWVFRNYANSKGLTLDQFVQMFAGQVISTDDVIDLMLWGSKYAHAKANHGSAFPFTDIDSAEWFDALGGMTGEKVKDLLAVIAGTLFNREPAELADKIKHTEKKSE